MKFRMHNFSEIPSVSALVPVPLTVVHADGSLSHNAPHLNVRWADVWAWRVEAWKPDYPGDGYNLIRPNTTPPMTCDIVEAIGFAGYRVECPAKDVPWGRVAFYRYVAKTASLPEGFTHFNHTKDTRPDPESLVDVITHGGKEIRSVRAGTLAWGSNIAGYRVMSVPRTPPDLCEDEGCPQHGTPHVCVERLPIKHLVDLCVQLHECCAKMKTMSAMDAVDNGYVDGAAELGDAIRAEIVKIASGEPK